MSEAAVSSFDHAGITVSDLDASIDFYVKELGFELLVRRDGLTFPHMRVLVGHPDAVLDVAMLAVPGGSKLELVHYSTSAGAKVRNGSNDAGALHIAFRVPDMEGLVARLRQRGIEFVSVPQTSPVGPSKGAQFVYCRDPDGAIIEFIQPVA
jgi:catechol 2,3-dioxygenase-like lactoylglutathione lyase family enzyme